MDNVLQNQELRLSAFGGCLLKRRLVKQEYSIRKAISYPFLVLLACCAVPLAAADAPPLRVFSVPPGTIERLQKQIARRQQAPDPAYQSLLAAADRDLHYEPESVMQKEHTPKSGDKHDYMSQAPYFWPNPSKPDGLPYIRKDGRRNPEVSQNGRSDAGRMVRMTSAMRRLALAWRLSGKDPYATHAARLLRAWFLDPQTRMNPNMEFAQAVPGVSTGRGTGMIESRQLLNAIDAVGLLDGSSAWNSTDQKGMEVWFRSFLTWATTSRNGKDEAAAINNHGSFYDAQIACIALFVREKRQAQELLRSVPARRLAKQIRPDGSQPLELDRADSFSYSRFNLRALIDLAILGDHAGVDLWHSTGTAGIRQAADFLLPYVQNRDKKWPYRQKNISKKDGFGPALWPLAVVYGGAYRPLAQAEQDDRSLEHLLWSPLLESAATR